MAKVLDRDMAENQNVIQIDENEWKRAAPAREVRKVPCSNNAADSLAADTPLLEVSNAIPEPSGQKHSPPSPHMALSTTSTQVTIALCSPGYGDWHQTSSKSPKQSSKNSKKQLSSRGQTPPGYRHCTWSPKRTAPGGPAAITAASTPSPPLTGTHSQTCRTWPTACTAALS
jgi:hypothetical protein